MKRIKPISNSRRGKILIDYKKVLFKNKETPRYLKKKIKSKSGRNNQGRITTRHQGGRSAKKIYRIIDYKRDKNDIEGTVKTIEYDPNRSCFISLISYTDGEYRFILSPEGIKIGDKIISGESSIIPIKLGNSLSLKYIPTNTPIHNVEMNKKQGGILVRSAGSWAEIKSKEENGKYVTIKMPSKEIRRILSDCKATIGRIGNIEHNLARKGKAGCKRWLGVRPTVRGSAMNPVDHPHGGGEGKAGIGRKSPLSPWGKKTLGKKTRKKRNKSNSLILKRRK